MRALTTVFMLALPALALAACSSGDATKNADGDMSETDVATEMAQANSMQPGQYSATMQIVRFDIPGMPPEALAQMREQMSSSMSVENSYCLTAEEARANREDMLKRLSNAEGDCRFEQFDVDGDAIEGRMVCSGLPGGGQMTMSMNGTMTATTSDVTMDSQMSNPSVPQANARMVFRVNSRRTGECTTAGN